MNQQLWKESIEFHGHECPGLAIGFRACEIAREHLEIPEDGELDVACISETEKCPVDAVRFLFGCKEEDNLTIRKNGVSAFSFMNHDNGKGVRVVYKGTQENIPREEMKQMILEDPWENWFWVMELL
jgi:formylmethanofuran dehydrogenase subunit E